MSDKIKLNHHISEQFNADLEMIRSRVLAMGGLVEQQLSDSIRSIVEQDLELATAVTSRDYQINALEVEIDEECSQVIALRQPAATDLRLVIAVIKTITDLERIGDEAERIAKMALSIAESESHPKNRFSSLETLGDHVRHMLHDTLDAFARTDAESAVQVWKQDRKIDSQYENIMRQLMTYMMEDARTIPSVLDAMWAARSLERIGDRARNICEYVIYLVKGKDVRHTSYEVMQQEVS